MPYAICTRRASLVSPLLLSAAVIMLGLISAMNLIDRFIFFPDSDMVGSPADLALAYEDVWFHASDGIRLHGWYVPGARDEVLLWFHGNAGNISHRLDHLRLLHDQVGAHVFMIDYRQYGRSEGEASERGVYLDARGALSYLRGRPDTAARIVYYGQSLGSAVAVDLAATDPPLGMILESPFLSLQEMASTMLPRALLLALPSSFDNLRKIAGIRTPLLFIHGDRDEIVPYDQGRRLFAAASPPKAFYTVRGASHNDPYLVGSKTYFRRIREFIDKL